jgi:hypothetical protein
MFPHLPPQGANNPHLEEGLIALGEDMRDDSNEIPERLGKLIAAGYTYLGQFIDHDLTFDIIPLHAANPDAERRQNYRTPFLDLDQLYGGGPTLSPFLYRNRQQDRGKESFLLGKTRTVSSPAPTATPSPTPAAGTQDALGDDLPRNSEGIALVGDPRQDENLIIAQLHVAFLRVHNWVLNKLESGKLKSGPEGATCFEQARRLVTWHYQWIVRNDYLEKILDKDVYAEITKPEYEPRMASRPGDFRIPIEFSGAAFRFGHSMVRNQYEFNPDHREATLKELLRHTGIGGEACPSLPAEWKIRWTKFFEAGAGMTARASNPIDTRIAGGLYELSKDTKGDPRGLFAATMPGESARCNPPTVKAGEDDLPVITLLRGARMELPSGQAVARALGVEPLTDDEIIKYNGHMSHKETLIKYGFQKDTPLWYYILKEAEVRERGCRLGPTGSKIVGDVIMSALLNDPNSYLSVKTSDGWKPTLPVCFHDPKSFEMSDLIRFSEDPDWDTQQPCP